MVFWFPLCLLVKEFKHNNIKQREEIWKSIEEQYDLLVIGGGASGLGVALDAVSRGFKVLLVEATDFGKGTSSKATKLLHGGVRYLAQGNISLVYEALRERTNLIENASQLSSICPFIIPIYTWWDALQYTVGLSLYDLLAGNKSLGRSRWLGKEAVQHRLPNVQTKKLKGGVLYYDGQFDDARLCIDTVRTIEKHGGHCLNYCKFIEFLYDINGGIIGGLIEDQDNLRVKKVQAKAVVNASGVFFEQVMNLQKEESSLKIVPSRGSHLVLDASFLKSDYAIMIPKTSDGRVLFIIPWHGKVIVGTTDEVSDRVELDPKATERDIAFILENASQYLTKAPLRTDILATFAGLRPLAAPKSEGKKSKEISRSHKILQSSENLFSLLGGKWTTYRKMGEDTLDTIIKAGRLPRQASTSLGLHIDSPPIMYTRPTTLIHPSLPYSWEHIDYAIQNEMIMHAEDVLARRSRCLFLDKEASLSVAPLVIAKIAQFYQKSEAWEKEEWIRYKAYAETFG